jgi:hypothetical protein
MKLQQLLKSDIDSLKLFSKKQIERIEFSLISGGEGEKLYLKCLRRNKKSRFIQSLKLTQKKLFANYIY